VEQSLFGRNPVQVAYRGIVVVVEQAPPAEGNVAGAEAVATVFSSSLFRLKHPVQDPTSNPFHLAQLSEMRDAERDCGEHYFASQWSLLAVYRMGTAFQWLDRSAEETLHQSWSW